MLSLALAALFATSAAHASLISFSASHGPALTDWLPGKTLALQQFNPQLGTLNAVTFVFSGGMRSDFDAETAADTDELVTNSLTGTLRFLLPTATEYKLDLSGSQKLMLAAKSSFRDSISDNSQLSVSFMSDLLLFTGQGKFNMDVFAEAKALISGSGNLEGGALTYATASASVTYDYTPTRQAVPEPASLALVGLALGALLLSRRRA